MKNLKIKNYKITYNQILRIVKDETLDGIRMADYTDEDLYVTFYIEDKHQEVIYFIQKFAAKRVLEDRDKRQVTQRGLDNAEKRFCIYLDNINTLTKEIYNTINTDIQNNYIPTNFHTNAEFDVLREINTKKHELWVAECKAERLAKGVN